jgi:hypothetical protein
MIDEFGRPILLLADQDRKKRVKGLEAYKVFKKIIVYFLSREYFFLC